MVLIYVRIFRLFIYNTLIVSLNFIMVIEIVFFVSLSLSVKSQLMLFNCNSVLLLLSITGGSGWFSSVDCT